MKYFFIYSKPVSDIEPIDLSTRSFIISKCVDKIFVLSSVEIMENEESQSMLTLEHLCKLWLINLILIKRLL